MTDAAIPPLTPELADKRDRLLEILRGLGSVAVAFSGGIDSTVVSKAAVLALGDRAIAVTADSASVPRTEIAEARDLARQIGIRLRVVATAEFDDPDYMRNDGARCYFCKSELYSRIETLLPELGIAVICSGANLDDLGDYRPGLKAAIPCRKPDFAKRTDGHWPSHGNCRLGTSPRRHACRAGWRLASK
jgi:uncharacterized protein